MFRKIFISENFIKVQASNKEYICKPLFVLVIDLR